MIIILIILQDALSLLNQVELKKKWIMSFKILQPFKVNTKKQQLAIFTANFKKILDQNPSLIYQKK